MTETNHLSSDYQKAITLETKLAFLRPTQEQDTIESTRRELAETLSRLVNQKISPETLSAITTLHGMDLQGLGVLSGSLPNKDRCAFAGNKKKFSAAWEFHWLQRIDLMRKIIDKASGQDDKLSHASRRQALGVAINSLEKAIAEIGDTGILVSKARLDLARALFHRGRIVRPKGFSVPGKKKELFLKALDQIRIATNNKDDDQTLFLKAEIYLEWLRFFPMELPEDLDVVFKAAQQKADEPLKTNLILMIGERGSAKPIELEALQNIEVDEKQEPLTRARAAAISGNWDICAKYLSEAIKKLEIKSFFHQDWEEAVELLKKGRTKISNYQWATICKSLWKLTVQKENRTSNGCHLRWYWSRQREVYDLAFEAAGNDYSKKAKITDSLKGRPALHFAQMETIAEGEDEIKTWIEHQEAGFLNQYISAFESADQGKKPGNLSWPKLPKGWIAVHFYLGLGTCSGEKKGYALIQNGQDWYQRTFDYEVLWVAYLAWQTMYGKCGHLDDILKQQEVLSPVVESLCEQIGKEMPWLFDPGLFPEGQAVVFIPHDFLHRLPLHMALDPKPDPGKAQLFLSLHLVLSLPAWWQASETNSPPAPDTVKANEKIFLANFENPSDAFQSLIDAIPKSVKVERVAKKSNLLEANSPSLLVVYCNGEAQPGNPFASRLLFSDSGLPVSGILGSTINLRRSNIILGACETDLMLALNKTLDEHITLSSAFIQKGAELVSGTLWKIHENDEIDFIKLALVENSSLHEQWLKWYDTNIKAYENDPKNNPRVFYKAAAIRIVGKPWTIEDIGK